MSIIPEESKLNTMTGAARASWAMALWAALVEYVNDYFSGQKHKFCVQKRNKQK